jgi:hypothetical protein
LPASAPDELPASLPELLPASTPPLLEPELPLLPPLLPPLEPPLLPPLLDALLSFEEPPSAEPPLLDDDEHASAVMASATIHPEIVFMPLFLPDRGYRQLGTRDKTPEGARSYLRPPITNVDNACPDGDGWGSPAARKYVAPALRSLANNRPISRCSRGDTWVWRR